MKSNIAKNQKLRLVAAVGLCFFSVVAVVTATVAWFTAFRKSDDENNGMTIVNPYGYFSRMDLYELTDTGGIDYANEKFHFKKTPKASAVLDPNDGTIDYGEPGTFTIEMDTYSDLDQHSPILMLITLNETITQTAQKPVTVYAACDKDYYFGEKEDNPSSPNYGQPKNEIKVWDEEHQTGEKNPLSSVVAFYSKAYTSLASITETNYYNVPIAEYDAESGYTRETFVQFNETTTEYQSFIQRKNLYEGTTGDVLYIAIVVDYYHYALEYVYNTFIGNTTLEDRIYFECDWNMVI